MKLSQETNESYKAVISIYNDDGDLILKEAFPKWKLKKKAIVLFNVGQELDGTWTCEILNSGILPKSFPNYIVGYPSLTNLLTGLANDIKETNRRL